MVGAAVFAELCLYVPGRAGQLILYYKNNNRSYTATHLRGGYRY